MGINFVYPSFLTALLLLSVPVFIHLFNLRRHRKVLFTNVKFLKEIQEETKNQSRLKHLIVLACRLLAVFFLVMAFAQPYIKKSNALDIAAQRTISIFIDNSFSMESSGTDGSMLMTAIVKAREIVEGFKEGDRFHLLSNDFFAWQQRLLSKEEMLDKLDELKISPASKSFSEVYQRQQSALQNSSTDQKLAFFISDAQKSIFEFEHLDIDSTIQYTIVPIKSSLVNNIAIDTCYFKEPILQLNKPASFVVQLRNYSDEDAEDVSIKVSVNGVQKIVGSLSIKAQSTAQSNLTLTPQQSGWQQIDIKIVDNPITFDDTYYMSVFMAERLSVSSINQNIKDEQYLRALFSPQEYIQFNAYAVGQIDYAAVQNSDFVMLNRLQQISSGLSLELNKFLKNGGSICLLLDSTADINSYNAFLNTWNIDPLNARSVNQEKVKSINYKDPIFEGVFEKESSNIDLPFVRSYFTQSLGSRSNRTTLIELQNGLPMLSSYACEAGQLYLWNGESIDESNNFIRHAIFVPAMFRMALLSQDIGISSYEIGVDNIIDISSKLSSGEAVYRIQSQDQSFDFIPRHKSTASKTSLFLHAQISMAGHYNVVAEGKNISSFSMNYNKEESDPITLENELIVEKLKRVGLSQVNIVDYKPQVSITKQISQISDGILLWKWCIVLCLIFIALEIAAIKFLKS
ncbi:MAG TPA: BatA domain-containing protein [Bacteroidia bacterium]|nr:BatA domain-containing protein [Bacteroidia bacterium]